MDRGLALSGIVYTMDRGLRQGLAKSQLDLNEKYTSRGHGDVYAKLEELYRRLEERVAQLEQREPTLVHGDFRYTTYIHAKSFNKSRKE